MRPGWTKPKAWKPKHETYLRRFYARLPLERIAKKLRRTPMSVKSRASKLRLSRGRRFYTTAEDKVLRAQYPHRPTKEIAKLLGRPLSAVYRRAAHHLGLRKTAEYMMSPAACRLRQGDNVGMGFRFLPGHVPANKGLRRPGYAPGRMAETQFKKGQRPHTYLPIGTIKANTDGYLRIKVADDRPGRGACDQNWEFVHRRVWEAAHGPIPKGHRIWWKDRNHANCALENLELLSDQDHMARTTIHNMPPELKSTILWAGALKRRIGRITRGKEQTHGSARPSV
jgi:hypothetical protein